MAWTSQQTRLLAAVILLGLLSTLGLHAQDNDELEYRMELGGGAGACFYLGDANKTPFAGLSGMGGVIVRRIFNPRMCIKGNLAIGHIRGNSNGYFIPTDPDSGTPEGGIPCEVSFIKLSSYEGTSSTGQVRQLMGLNQCIKGRTVVIVEDIVDTGLTMQKLLELLQAQEPAEVHIATLLLKPDKLKVPLHIEYVAMQIPNDFIVGYGLDYDGFGRNYKDIYTVVSD